MTTYTVFKRSCTNWEQFSRARKITVATNVDGDTARKMCKEYNDNRTPAQIRKGTKMEFTS